MPPRDRKKRFSKTASSFDAVLKAVQDCYHLHHYNQERLHQGRMVEGRTAAQMLDAGKTQQHDPQDVFAEAA